MARRPLLAGAAVLAFAAVAFFAARSLTGSADDEAIVELTRLATTSRDDFPAIVDSGVRDPDDRIAPVAARLEVVEVVDHDDEAFTQGLELAGPRLFESTGLVGSSTLRELDPSTGAVLRSVPVPDVFAEGITIVGDEIVQLTWTEGIAYRYDLETFEVVGSHSYDGEGWGLCLDTDRLVMSDGGPRLTFRDPVSFEPIGGVDVTFSGAPVERINELECVDGTVWANIWKTPLVIEIDPGTGRVLTVLDARELRPESTLGRSGAVLNGIAHDAATGEFLLTGKLWPRTYRVRITAP